MKYIKEYESLSPQIGDYVKMRTDSKDINLILYYNENIGRIINIGKYHVKVSFKNTPPKSAKQIFDYDYKKDQYEKMFNTNKLVDFSKLEEDLIKQIKYDTKKYNI